MPLVKFKVPYSGSVTKFKECRVGDTIEVNEIEKSILMNLGVIEGSLDYAAKVTAIAKENLKTKEEKFKKPTLDPIQEKKGKAKEKAEGGDQ